MRKIVGTVGMIVILVFGLVQFSSPAPALASPETQATAGGLAVGNAILNLSATPGQVYIHKMLVGSGAGAQPMDIQVDAMGFGEGLNGEFIPLSPDADQSPYSARTFITQISNPSFHLDPGAQVEVDATLTIPQNLGTDSRYAIIYIHSAAVSMSGQNGVGQILAVSVPVIITPKNAALNQTGAIQGITIDPVESGKPITIQALVKNTGNRHFKIKGAADITDPSGKAVTQLIYPLTSTSVFPTFTRQVIFTYSSLDHPGGLAPGKYGVDIKIWREDGTLVDEKQASFDVTQPFTPFPGVDQASLATSCFTNQEPGTIDASAKADLKIQFEGTGPVTGCVAIVKYPQEPAVTPTFEDAPGNGGMGGLGVKFIGIQVTGFNQGSAHLLVDYRTNELTVGLTADSLFLANHAGSSWGKLENLEVQSGSQLVTGDIDVIDLTNGALIALGGTKTSNLSLLIASLLSGSPILDLLILLVVLVLIGLVIFAVQRSRQPKRKK